MDNVLTLLDQMKQRALQEEIPTAEDLQQIANAPISLGSSRPRSHYS